MLVKTPLTEIKILIININLHTNTLALYRIITIFAHEFKLLTVLFDY
jgi:hypothetical protein